MAMGYKSNRKSKPRGKHHLADADNNLNHAVYRGYFATNNKDTQFIMKFIADQINTFTKKMSTSKNFATTVLVHTCDLRISYTKMNMVVEPNEFVTRSALFGAGFHQLMASLIDGSFLATDEAHEINKQNYPDYEFITEQKFRINVNTLQLADENDEYAVVLKPDLIIRNKVNNECYLVDWKTFYGSLRNFKPKFEDRRQMLIYSTLLPYIGYNITKIFLVYFLVQRMKIVPFVLQFSDKDKTDALNEIRNRINAFHIARQNQTLPMKHVGEWCKNCPFKKLCQNNVSPFIQQ
jgi:CRISPR/Cas system-associated exonuclease Cas4 (RecB family)